MLSAGSCLASQGSLYEWKRSSTLLKVKTFFDEEAKVIGHKEGKGKNEGLMGALHCETPDGRQFDVGSGFTAAQRSRPPPVGSIVTYRFQELSKALHPRFPTYIDTREDLDWDEYVEEYEAPTKAESKLKRNHTLLFSESLGHRTDEGDEDDGGASGGAAAAAAAAAPAKRRKTAKAAKKPKAGLDPASMDPAKLRVVVNGEPCELRSHQRDAVTQWLGNQPTDMLHPPERKDFKGKLHYVDQSNDHHEIVKASAVWSWQSSNGGPAKWTPYSAADSEQLEAAFEAGSGGDSFDPLGSVSLGNGYVVDLVRMVQHPEGAPKRVRRVQRSGPAAAKASNPYAAAKVKKAKPAADVIDLADDMETDDAAAAGQKQFALTAVAQPPPPPKVAAKYTKPRGIQPKQILVPDDGQEIVLGRGAFGITDPYMSKRQAAVSTVQRHGGETALRFTALGTNGCLYRKVGMASGAWEKLATKTTGGGDEEGDEQASDGVMLVDGDELCLLADKTMRFAVVDARSVGP